jgi:hypothetical protein
MVPHLDTGRLEAIQYQVIYPLYLPVSCSVFPRGSINNSTGFPYIMEAKPRNTRRLPTMVRMPKSSHSPTTISSSWFGPEYSWRACTTSSKISAV